MQSSKSPVVVGRVPPTRISCGLDSRLFVTFGGSGGVIPTARPEFSRREVVLQRCAINLKLQILLSKCRVPVYIYSAVNQYAYFHQRCLVVVWSDRPFVTFCGSVR